MAVTARKRADGEASTARILDAAAQIAGERGFQGTSISAVSARSGLPASSIYWHFANKDELIAAVIDRSYQQWSAALDEPVEREHADGAEELAAVMRRVGETLEQFPDFLRLGLLLILDRDPAEPTARAKFLAVRRTTADGSRRMYEGLFPDLATADLDRLVALTLVLSDGVFIARDAGDLEVDDAYDLMTAAILGTVSAMRAGTAGGGTPAHQ